MHDPDPKRPADSAPPTDAWRHAAESAPVIEVAPEFAVASSPAAPPPVPGSSGSGPGSGAGASRSVPHLAPGDLVDAYLIEQPLGIGGMGSVFLARDQRLDRPVALKVLPPEQNGIPENVQRFVQEGRSAARLDHENIARVYCLGQDRGTHFIAFEYVEGETIRQRVERRGCLPIHEVLDLGQQVTAALMHASARGVVHRDIKPSNILVTPEGGLKLVDMGLARQFERDSNDPGLTQSGMTLGTFDYISPEQARDPRDVDVRSDLYSLGCTLYWMLTGRPPFPGGTVLQKLLQHQEEPAPDVRSLRPDVPAGVAAIIRKLLEKDRGLRHQTPEELRVDLEAAARELDAEREPVPVLDAPSGWEQHLVWGIPAIGLALVVAVLSWWGQASEPSGWPADRSGGGANPPRLAATAKPASSSASEGPGESVRNSAPASPNEVAAPSASEPARSIAVGSETDLTAALAAAPSGSTLTLTDNGPYLLTPVALDGSDGRAAPAAPPRTLTLRADALAQPVLRVRTSSQPLRQDAAMLAFRGGRVHIQGIEFQLESESLDATLSALGVDGAELTLSGCLFRGRSATGSAASLRALDVHSSTRPAAAAQPPTVRAVACFVDAGVVGVFSRGPLDIAFRDCLFGPGQPVAWVDNPSDRAAVPAEILLRHCSVLTGGSPVFRFTRTLARLEVENTAIGPAFEEPTVLVASDDPARLEWLGRENLYGPMASYLLPLGSPGRFEPIVSFTQWEDAPDGIREIRSRQTDERIWVPADPVPLLTRRDPAAAFALTGSAANVGARRGPNALFVRIGSSLAGLFDLNAASRGRTVSDSPTESPGRPAPPASPAETGTRPNPTLPELATAAARPPEPAPMEVRSEDVGRSPMQVGSTDSASSRPMIQAPPDSPETGTGSGSPGASGVTAGSRNGSLAPRPFDSTPAAVPDSPMRQAGSAAELRSILLAPTAAAGARVRLGSFETLSLGPTSLPARSRSSLQGEPTGRRSRLELRLDRAADRELGTTPALFSIPAGSSLELVDLDIVLPRGQRPADGRWSAFALAAGASLSLQRCTVTQEGPEAAPTTGVGLVAPSVIRIGPGAGPDANPTVVRIEDCVIRAEGDVIDESSGRRAELAVVNAIVSCGGRLLHGRGLPSGRSDDAVSLTLRQATARVFGGLVLLEGDARRSPLRRVVVQAFDSILSTGGTGVPLLRAEGPSDLESLSDRIAWEGQRVVYHDIEVYRRDASARSGASTIGETRASWEVAVRDHETAPFHGDAHFQRPPAPTVKPWQIVPDDLRLAPDSPVPLAGPRMDQLPTPPATDL